MNLEDIEKAKQARLNSYSPYSNFQVGAALRTKSGKVYMGCNIENHALLAICGERTAFLKAISEGENEFESIIYNISNNANKKVEIAFKKNNIFKIIKNINKNKQKQKQKRINLYNKLGQIEINENDNNSNTVYATQEYKYLIFNKATKYFINYFNKNCQY